MVWITIHDEYFINFVMLEKIQSKSFWFMIRNYQLVGFTTLHNTRSNQFLFKCISKFCLRRHYSKLHKRELKANGIRFQGVKEKLKWNKKSSNEDILVT